MMVSLPSSIRVMATASRPLARWCALEGRCLCKTISNQWRTLTEGLNGPSMKAFNCLAKLISSSRMKTATQNTLSEETCIEDRFGGKKKEATHAGWLHTPQQLLPGTLQMHPGQTGLSGSSRARNLANTGRPLTGRLPWIQIQRRRWTEVRLDDDNWRLQGPF